jgi:serine/threonine-protein kinase HipA
LTLCLNGRTVGAVRRAGNGTVTFDYDNAWLEWRHAFPISQSLPLREESFTGETVTNVFDNLLPDSMPIRRQIAERVGAGGVDPISLLEKIGRDCVGALQFLPAGQDCSPSGEVQGKALSPKQIAALMKSLAAAPLGLTSEDETFRISIAGAQEKTALLYLKGKWILPAGMTPSTHILKPQIGKRSLGMGQEIDLTHSVENEHFCMTFCTALGLPTSKSRIIDFGGERVFVSERFDRRWTREGNLLRLPQEDFCQALNVPSTLKYEASGGPGIEAGMKLLQASDSPQADRRTFFKSLLAFWVLGATDGHAKNFSILLSPGGGFSLAPLYDILSTEPHVANGELPKKNARLAMAVGKGRHYRVDEIVPRHFRETANMVGFPSTELVAVEKEIAEGAEGALAAAKARLPKDCPQALPNAIAAGVRARVALLKL